MAATLKTLAKEIMTTKSFNLSEIMKNAWSFIKMYGFTMSEALKKAWANAKVVRKLHEGVVKFYFQKVDGTLREAWGTLVENLIPSVKGCGQRANTVQVYFDTEKAEWRCYKKVNLIGLA